MNVSAFDSLQQHPANSGFNAGQNTCIPTHLHVAMHSSDADEGKLYAPASMPVRIPAFPRICMLPCTDQMLMKASYMLRLQCRSEYLHSHAFACFHAQLRCCCIEARQSSFPTG